MIATRPVAVRPHLERLRFPALAALGSLVAHDAVFATHFGLGPDRDIALAATAHGYWPAFVVVAGLGVAAGTGAAITRVLRLHRLVRDLPATAESSDQPRHPSEVLHLWPRLLVVVAGVFLFQENVEHLAAGRGLPGLWAIAGPDYPLAIPVLVAVTGLLAFIGGWLQWHRETLIRRLRAAQAAIARRRQVSRVPDRRWALVAALIAHRWILLRRDAERAPPVPSAA